MAAFHFALLSQSGLLDLLGLGPSHIGKGPSSVLLPVGNGMPKQGSPGLGNVHVIASDARRQASIRIEHVGCSAGEGASFVMGLAAVTKRNSADMPGLMLEAPPHSGKAGAGPNFGRLVGGSIPIRSSLPSEVGRKEIELGASEVGELNSGIGVPLGHGFADIGAAEVMHHGI